MKKAALIAGALLVAGGLLLGPVLLGLIAVLFNASANAAQNPCTSPIGIVLPAGGPVRLPVVGAFVVTSEFGMRRHPVTGEYRMHAGMDLAEQPGPGPVVAALAGVVAATPTSSGGGNEIVLDHGAGLTTRYLHLASRTVQVGDEVWAGKQIGVEGNTGTSTGAHLHFEVHQNGQPTNPRDWLTRQGIAVPAPGGSGRAPAAATTPVLDGIDAPLPGRQPTLGPPVPSSDPGDTDPVVATMPNKVGPYRGEQVRNAALVIKAGQALQLDARTITIGVMTAMGESSLINVGHGDAAGPDSRGLFQQRSQGWGTLADRMNPTIAATNFFKALVAVPGYLQLEPTLAAHKAQRNADPYHYRPYWPDAVQMVAALTADPSLLESLPATGPITGCADGGPAAPPEAGDGSGAAIVEAARHYLGTPYSWGGGNTQGPSLGSYSSASLDGTRTVGFDCSGLVLFAVYNATGLQLPHSAEAQGHDSRGAAVPRDWAALRPGDVIAFSEDGSGRAGSFGHVGIYVGNGQMIHAPRPGKNVEIVQLRGSSYYEPMSWSIRRYATIR